LLDLDDVVYPDLDIHLRSHILGHHHAIYVLLLSSFIILDKTSQGSKVDELLNHVMDFVTLV